MKRLKVLLIVGLWVTASLAALSFTQAPSITHTSGTWTIEFTVSESTDVEVSIINMHDSTIIRHLAAGVLGGNPPAPLAANTFHQTLAWDGKDDFGKAMTASVDSISVRVRAGMGINFEQFVGGNPYAFKDENSGYWSFNGMSEGDNGLVYVSGTPEPEQFACIRAYDGSGNYVRTVFPFRGDLQSTQVSGFGVNNWLNGQYSPTFAALHGPTLTSTILASFNGYSMLPINGPGEVAVGGGKGLQCFKFNSDGSVPNGSVQVGLVTSPAMPNHYYTFGPIYLNPSHNPDFIYLSGYAEAAQVDAGCHFVLAADTGFWRDGCVYKINLKTGVTTQFIALTGVPLSGALRDTKLGGPSDFFTAVHSVKAAANGNVLICDRINDQIAIYDSNGVFLRAITNVPDPDQLCIDKSTGALYVACRSGWHYDAKPLILKKFSGIGATDTLVYSITLWTNYGEGAVNLFARTGSDTKPKLWISNGDVGVRIYSDEGDTVALVKDFYAVKVNNLGFDRIALDRRSETVYINNGSSDLYKITDWSNPAMVRCSTAAKQKLYAGDASVSYDGQLYVREGSSFNGPISRYTLDAYHAPVNFSLTGTNSMTSDPKGDGYSPYFVYGRMGVGYGDKGFAVSPIDKHVIFMQMHNFAEYWVDTIPAEGTLDTIHRGGTWSPSSRINLVGIGGCGGVKMDLKGGLYIGATIAPAGHRTPSGFAGDFIYARGGSGSVIRYAPGDTGTVIQSSHSATNSSFIYKSNLGPMSGFGACNCRSSRFDVDFYGRLFIPSAVTQKVAVVDNNDNQILEFGRYGNWDEQASGSAIPFACPIGAAASDNFLYVSDLINTRLARIQLKYALDNMPGLTSQLFAEKGKAGGKLWLASSPNPFNPESRVTFTLPSESSVKLAVYDLSGRLIKTLATGVMSEGSHHVSWNATNERGAKVSAGLYIYRLTAGKRVLQFKTVLAK